MGIVREEEELEGRVCEGGARGVEEGEGSRAEEVEDGDDAETDGGGPDEVEDDEDEVKEDGRESEEGSVVWKVNHACDDDNGNSSLDVDDGREEWKGGESSIRVEVDNEACFNGEFWLFRTPVEERGNEILCLTDEDEVRATAGEGVEDDERGQDGSSLAVERDD